mmetsp:Transcript_31859/g.62716  ORF Transcript_31859/g.62716 Transcript_31859/m.62716 type:complete len:240 (+) Transcript_31859:385-1104(+)
MSLSSKIWCPSRGAMRRSSMSTNASDAVTGMASLGRADPTSSARTPFTSIRSRSKLCSVRLASSSSLRCEPSAAPIASSARRTQVACASWITAEAPSSAKQCKSFTRSPSSDLKPARRSSTRCDSSSITTDTSFLRRATSAAAVLRTSPTAFSSLCMRPPASCRGSIPRLISSRCMRPSRLQGSEDRFSGAGSLDHPMFWIRCSTSSTRAWICRKLDPTYSASSAASLARSTCVSRNEM